MNKFYPTVEQEKLCVNCWYARMRKDICGIYCTTGFVKGGKCERFEDYNEHKKKKQEVTHEILQMRCLRQDPR